FRPSVAPLLMCENGGGIGMDEGRPTMQTPNHILDQLDALDEVILSIASELDLDAVLQRIVDLARTLVGARYCALGIVGADGFLTDFITSGISQTEREAIGAPPRGHGILGLLVREQRSLRLPDLSKHPQS